MNAFTDDYSSLRRGKHTSWPIFTDVTINRYYSNFRNSARSVPSKWSRSAPRSKALIARRNGRAANGPEMKRPKPSRRGNIGLSAYGTTDVRAREDLAL